MAARGERVGKVAPGGISGPSGGVVGRTRDFQGLSVSSPFSVVLIRIIEPALYAISGPRARWG